MNIYKIFFLKKKENLSLIINNQYHNYFILRGFLKLENFIKSPYNEEISYFLYKSKIYKIDIATFHLHLV